MAPRLLVVLLSWLPSALAGSLAPPVASGSIVPSNASNSTNETVWTCAVCAYVYDPVDGSGLAFEELPAAWSCPVCGQLKAAFTNASNASSDRFSGRGLPAGSWACTVCMHEYDPAADGEGMAFEDLPEEWTCPVCGQLKSAYKHVGSESLKASAPEDKWACGVCMHEYDAAVDGDGKAFEDLPDDWTCPVCGQPKSAYIHIGAESLKASARDDQWACTVCMHEYDAAADGEGKVFEDLPDNWTCPVCGAPKSAYMHIGAESLKVSAPEDKWACTVCMHEYDAAIDGDGKAFKDLPDDWTCPVCGQPKSAYMHIGAESLKASAQDDQWACTVCMHEYDAAADGEGKAFEDLQDDWTCPVCGAPKSAYKHIGAASLRASASEGIWACTVCMHEYDAAADGDGKAFEDLPDDWTCPVCGQPKSAYKHIGAESLKVSASEDKWACTVCMHEYDAAVDGDGKAFEDLPDDWTCPVCGQPKSAYMHIGAESLKASAPDDQWACTVCMHEYDAAADGDGKAFKDLPEDWTCPVCGAPKSAYKHIGELVVV